MIASKQPKIPNARAGKTYRYHSGGHRAMMPIYDWKTKNKSFLEVHEQLKMLGIKNNAFFLILLNPLLQGVDPHDPNISKEMALMVLEECSLNIFYFLREVVRIPEQGAGTVQFRLDRGTLAALYCFANNQNFYLMKPRQTGKSVGICAMLAWAFKFGITNGQFMFSANKDKIGKDNLKRMKTYIGLLPSYIAKAGTVTKDSTGKTVRKTNNIKSYVEPVTNNSASVANTAISNEVAEEIGRGDSHNFEFFDEAEFTSFIETIVNVSGPAFLTASRNAINNGAYSCRIFATTPGDLSDKRKCQSALKIVNDAVPWDEKFYDVAPYKFKMLVNAKSNYGVVYIEYDYKQLGLGEDWFREACRQVGNNVNKIRREILLQRFSGNSESPFTEDDITELKDRVKSPVYVQKIAKIYKLLFYVDPKEIPANRVHFISIDPSDGTGSDRYAFTVLDPYTQKTIMEFRSAWMTPRGCIELCEYIVVKYFRKPLIIIESNRNGLTLIDLFDESWLKQYIYRSQQQNATNSILTDDLDEQGFVKDEISRRRYNGVKTDLNSRPMMMNILVDAVRFKKDILDTKYIFEDINNLVIKNNKIQAASGEHDDSIMSWCLGMYVLYYGERLERWGYVKGGLPDDVVEDDEFIRLEKLYRNPEIRKEFPTMYTFYMHTIKPQKEQEHKINTFKKLQQHTAEAMGSIRDDLLKSDPTLNNTNFNQNPDDEWKQDLVTKWNSLNKV